MYLVKRTNMLTDDILLALVSVDLYGTFQLEDFIEPECFFFLFWVHSYFLTLEKKKMYY